MRTTAIILIALAMIFTACKKKTEIIPVTDDSGNGKPTSSIVPEKLQYVLVLEFAPSCPCQDAEVTETLNQILTHSPIWQVPVICNRIYTDDSLTKRMYRLYSKDALFFINDQPVDNTEQISDMVSTVLTREPEAQTNFTIKKNGQKIIANTTTTFFVNTNGGDYYLALYALEDGLGDSTAKFNHILRASSLDNSALGAKIVTGSAASGTTIRNEYTITCPANCNMANVTVAAVLWKVGSDTTFVNAYEKK